MHTRQFKSEDLYVLVCLMITNLFDLEYFAIFFLFFLQFNNSFLF